MKDDPASAAEPPRRPATSGRRPASILLAGVVYLFLAAYLAIAPFVSAADGRGRPSTGLDALTFRFEVPDALSWVLALAFFLVGVGLLRRRCRFARIAASLLALLSLVLGVLGEWYAFVSGQLDGLELRDGPSVMVVLQFGVRIGLLACGFGLLFALLNSAPVRHWCAGPSMRRSSSGPDTDAAPLDVRAAPQRLGCLHGSIGLTVGLMVGVAAVYYVVVLFLRLIGGILGGGVVH